MSVDAATQALIAEAGGKLRILDVFLRKSEIQVPEHYIPFGTDNPLSFQHRFFTYRQRLCEVTESESSEPVDVVEYMVIAEARLISTDVAQPDDSAEEVEDKSVFGEIAATFSAVYRQNGCRAEAVEAFGRHNVQLHVWPYWREYLQNVLSRMRLPTVTLGMMVPGTGGPHTPATIAGPYSEAEPSKG